MRVCTCPSVQQPPCSPTSQSHMTPLEQLTPFPSRHGPTTATPLLRLKQDPLKSQTETPKSSRKNHAPKALLSFPLFPHITVSSQLGHTSEDLAAQQAGRLAGRTQLLAEGQMNPSGLTPRLRGAPDTAICPRTIPECLEATGNPESHGAVHRVWESISVGQPVALIRQCLGFRWPGRGWVGET